MSRLQSLTCMPHGDGRPRVRKGTILAIFPLLGALATASPEQEANTVSSVGSRLLGSNFETVFSAGQPSGISATQAGTYVHYAGLLGCSAIRPTNDLNSDGVADEWDADNDSDGLADYDEVTGAAFGGHATTDHNSADTDGDGMSDGDEAMAMFDPRDAVHSLRILSIERSDGGNGTRTLRWVGKGGGSINAVWMADGGKTITVTNYLSAQPYTGGEFPWYKVTNTYQDVSGATESRFYQVRIPIP